MLTSIMVKYIVKQLVGIMSGNMSTPAYKKRARQELHQQKKIERKRELLWRPTHAKKPEFREYRQEATYRRETPNYPSLQVSSNISNGSTAKRESVQYTGDYLVGIATMHKSNLVPVGRDTDPKDFSTMRRN